MRDGKTKKTNGKAKENFDGGLSDPFIILAEYPRQRDFYRWLLANQVKKPTTITPYTNKQIELKPGSLYICSKMVREALGFSRASTHRYVHFLADRSLLTYCRMKDGTIIEMPLPKEPPKPRKKASDNLAYNMQHWSIALYGVLKAVYLMCGLDKTAYPKLDKVSMGRFQTEIKRLGATDQADENGNRVISYRLGVKKLCAAILHVQECYELKKSDYWFPIPLNILQQNKIAKLVAEVTPEDMADELPEDALALEEYVWQWVKDIETAQAESDQTPDEPERPDTSRIDAAHKAQQILIERSSGLVF